MTHPLAILNTAIATAPGDYEIRALALSEARAMVVAAPEILSAVGHQATADVLTALLGRAVPVNRIQFTQQPGQSALVLKLRGRIPEGVVLDVAGMEEIGYDLWLMTRRPRSVPPDTVRGNTRRGAMSNAKTLNEVVAAIRRVVAYDWEDEKADFEQHAGEESHIFRDLMAIREWLDGFPHGDELAEQPYRLRAFRERQGTLWHEVEPDRFRIALDDESHETTIARHWRWPTPGWSLDALRAECGPLTEVTEVAGT